MEKCSNVVWHQPQVNKQDRERIKWHRASILWLTGLPSSGKSTIAHKLEYILNRNNIHTYVLDGDNIRHGYSDSESVFPFLVEVEASFRG